MTQNPQLSIESRTIDFVPAAERYGTPRRLFTIWFSTNLTILGVAAGTLGIDAGLSFGWVFLALVLGNAVGTVFMAAHSAQGPHLGVPQMIQSRAQFGVRGAALPLAAVVVMYVLYCAANGVLMREVVDALLHLGQPLSLAVFSVVTVAVAFAGYELIHRLGAVLTVVSAGLFGAAAWLIWSHHGGAPAAAARIPHFSSAAFMLVATQAAAWSLSYGPYVADYSRYLPESVPASKTFWYTGLGCLLGSVGVMTFGAFIASLDPTLARNPGIGLAAVFGPLRPLVQLLIVVGVVEGNVMNLYSAYMSSVTVFSGIRGGRRVGKGAKLLLMAALMGAAALITLWAGNDFDKYFGDALNAMLYLLVPWSAINLADYYLVRRGRYDIAALYDPAGTYGAYRWNAISIYCLGVAVQVPFMQLSFYTGPVAHWLGADLAWIPGLLVSGVAYVMAERATRAAAKPVVSG